MPDTALGAMWRLGDMLREFRGDSHTAAWICAGLDATEIGLLSELYWGLPMRSYSRTRAWTDAQFDAAHERLKSRGLVDETSASPTPAAHCASASRCTPTCRCSRRSPRSATTSTSCST